MANYVLLPLLLSFRIILTSSAQAIGHDIKYLIPGRIHNSSPRNSQEMLSIYCYKGVPKHVLHFWQTAQLHLSLDVDQFESYRGFTPNDVLDEYEERRNSWTFNVFSWQSRLQNMDPFNTTCIGISTTFDHTVFLHIMRVDFWRVIQFVGGVSLFLLAPRLSSNPLFYYICGITLGVTASFLILVYVLRRIIPTGPVLHGFTIGGWTISLYLLRLMWQNLRTIIVYYQNYAIGYISFTAFISFAVCYRYGPVSDRRTKSLIQWTLQIAALGGMFLSSQFQEASMAAILLLLLYYNFPRSWITAIRGFWHRKFPPKIQLLTEDEYHEQGARETVKALEELRQYCSSPECNQWKTILRIKKPIRFAEFMEGQSHLSDEELLHYESDKMGPPSDDSD